MSQRLNELLNKLATVVITAGVGISLIGNCLYDGILNFN